jgi:hypothetical protein
VQLTSLLRLPRTVCNLQRVREVVGVVVRFGFGDLLFRLGLESAVAGCCSPGASCARAGSRGEAPDQFTIFQVPSACRQAVPMPSWAWPST